MRAIGASEKMPSVSAGRTSCEAAPEYLQSRAIALSIR